MHPVAVLLPTFNRAQILRETIRRLKRHVVGAELTFFVGNDHEVPLNFRMHNVFVDNAPSGSFGANLNRLLKRARNSGFKLVMQMDDDHHLLRRLDLKPHIAQLTQDHRAGWIRLMGIGSHKYTASLDGDYWRVHWDSPELYITSMRPHIKLLDFHEWYGLYPEGKKLGETEESFCHQCRDVARDITNSIVGVPPYEVMVPLSYDDSAWAHVGDSWQKQGY